MHVFHLWATILIIKQPSVPANFTWTHDKEQGFVTNAVCHIVANACVVFHLWFVIEASFLITWRDNQRSRRVNMYILLWAQQSCKILLESIMRSKVLSPITLALISDSCNYMWFNCEQQSWLLSNFHFLHILHEPILRTQVLSRILSFG